MIDIVNKMKTLAMVGGAAGTLTGCFSYVPPRAVVVPPPAAAVVAQPTTTVVTQPAAVVAPAPVYMHPAPVVVPAYRPFWWGPRFHHHHHHGRW